MEQSVINEIINASHTDVFSVLGTHAGSDGKQRVTVFLPGAVGVKVVSATGKTVLAQLDCVHKAGLFSGKLNRKKMLPYRLKVEYAQDSMLLDDPYRFPSLLSPDDIYLFNNGTQEQAWRFLGANHRSVDQVEGVLFCVWAPNASRVSVVGDFNFWDGRAHVMRKHPASGIWEIFIPGIAPGSAYKYEIVSASGRLLPLKADPYARQMQLRPETASVVPDTGSYTWQDKYWLQQRRQGSRHEEAVSIYEVHLGSWRRKPEEGERFLNYRELAAELVGYMQEMGYSHLQLMPVSEFPFDGSWGYQPLGMFAPTSRFGSPDEFKGFIDTMHQAGIGVLLDWVPGHFPTDAHGLGQFDGTHLYEHSDPRKGYHPDWNTLIYNYGRAEVCSYLISNALYWLHEYHVDGLRFDAVASMLYLDYSRKQDEWIPNHYGGRENLEAIDLLRSINGRAYFNFPGVMMVAEESTAWPGVTDFTDNGGLGFGFKWNLGWMNDTLSYMSRDPVHRKFHHSEMTFGLLYAFTENFILPLSHDEVVHGKRSIIERIPGDDWQKFAGLRAYYGFMWAHPGKKLMFMGDEFGHRAEWSHDRSLDWHLLEHGLHRGVQTLVRDLNRMYREYPALYEQDFSHETFQWIEADNHFNSVFIFLRLSRDRTRPVVCVVNMTPTVIRDYRIGVPGPGYYREVINSDSEVYGGSGQGNFGGIASEPKASHGREHSVCILVPPLATLMLVGD